MKKGNSNVEIRHYNVNDPKMNEEIKKTYLMCEEYNRFFGNDMQKAQKLLKENFGSFGENSIILPDIKIDIAKNMFIGNDTFINYNMVALSTAPIKIGNHVFIGPNLSLYPPIHPLEYNQRNKGTEWAEGIIIEDNVWIGGNVTILPGVTIKSGSVVGAGSLVTNDVEPDSLYFGNPAKFVRKIDND